MEKNLLLKIGFLVLSGLVGTARAEVSLLVSPLDGVSASQFSEKVTALRKNSLVLEAEPLFSPSESKALQSLGENQVSQSWKVQVRSDEDSLSLRRWIKNSLPGVLVEINSEARPQAEMLEARQWGIHNIGMPQDLAFDEITTLLIPGIRGEDIGLDRTGLESKEDRKIRVAILDTGVDAKHPDLRDVIEKKPGECDALEKFKACLVAAKTDADKTACQNTWARFDSDGNGYPMDCQGWNVTAAKNAITQIVGDAETGDTIGHGTHVAGIVAAQTNGIGVRGVARNVVIIPVKVIKAAPNAPIRPQAQDIPSPSEKELQAPGAFADLIARGVLYAIRSQAQIINLSLAWPKAGDTQLMRKMVALAQAQGILVIASAGNDSTDASVYPCSYTQVICVAAHGPDGALSHFSNFGPSSDLAAPGLEILSTWPEAMTPKRYTEFRGYEIRTGTSMAAPFVAGILARILSAQPTISGDEAYARLIAGARAHRESAQFGPAPVFKYTLSGNADLPKSLEATPTPIFSRLIKEPILLSWDLSSNLISVPIQLKNRWAQAQSVKVETEILEEASGLNGAEVVGTGPELGSWKSGELKEWAQELRVKGQKLGGRIVLVLKIQADRAPIQKIYIPLEISVPLSHQARVPGQKTIPVQGQVLPNASLRSVVSQDGKNGQDYLAIESKGAQTELQLIRPVTVGSSTQYMAGKPVSITAVTGTLLTIQRVADSSGRSLFIIIYQKPAASGMQLPSLFFQVYDENLSPSYSWSYDNQTSVMPENFQWVRMKSADGKVLPMPVWSAYGKTPPAEKKPYDPWDPNPRDPLTRRLYYLTPEGIRSLTPADDKFAIGLMFPKDEDKAEGQVNVLLGKGENYDLEYSIAVLRDGELGPDQPFLLSEFRNLDEASKMLRVTSLSPSLSINPGSAFSGGSARGSQRLTYLLDPRADQLGVRSSQDGVVWPAGPLDSVMNILGTFWGEGQLSAFSETHYQLQFTDFNRNESAQVSLNRFSFLPAFIFSKTMFPIVVSDTEGKMERLPALLIPAQLGTSESMEVVVPVYEASGKLLGLSRPARLRIKEEGKCTALGNPIGASAQAPTQAVFFCGDRFIFVPLSF